MGGWVIEQLGDIPAAGDRFVYKELTVTVDQVEDNRVTSVTIVYQPQPKEDE